MERLQTIVNIESLESSILESQFPVESWDHLLKDIQTIDQIPGVNKYVVLQLNANDNLIVISCFGFPNPKNYQHFKFPINDNTFIIDVIEKGNPTKIKRGGEFARLESALNFGEKGSYLVIPIDFYGKSIGMILFDKEQKPIRDEDVVTAKVFSEKIALKIGSILLVSDNLRKRKHLEIIKQASQNVNSNLDLSTLLKEVVKLIREALGYYHVHIFLVDEFSNQIVLQELSGEKGAELRKEGLKFSIGANSITSWVAAHRKQRIANDISKEPLFFAHALLPEVKSEATFPMLIGDTLVGVLDIQSKRLNAFRKEDAFALQIVADQTAIGIENAYLYEETRRQAEFYGALHDISLQITSRLENTTVIEVILEHAAKLINARASTLGIFDAEKGQILLTAGFNATPEVVGTKLKIGEGVAGQVIETRAPVYVNQYYDWEYASNKFSPESFNAVIGVPLWRNGQIYGTLVALDYQNKRQFTRSDTQKLSLFANFVSIVLGKSEMFSEIRKTRKGLKKKVKKRTKELTKAQVDLRNLFEKTLKIQEEERARIALDLHDGSNQLITGILYQIQAAEQSMHNHQYEQSIDNLELAKNLLRAVISENRNIINGLRPTILDYGGLVPALKWYSETQGEIHNLNFNFRSKGKIVSMADTVEIAIFRIVQESFQNTIEHANAENVYITTEYKDSALHLTIRDDGIGINPKSNENNSNHMGLIGIKERVTGIDGTLNIDTKPGKGVTISVKVPLGIVG